MLNRLATALGASGEIDRRPGTSPASVSCPPTQTVAASTWRNKRTIVMFVCSAIAILGSIIAIGFGSRAIDESKRNVRSPAASATTSGAAPATTGPAVPAANVLTPAAPVPVALNDFRVGLSSTNLAVGKYTFQISN